MGRNKRKKRKKRDKGPQASKQKKRRKARGPAVRLAAHGSTGCGVFLFGCTFTLAAGIFVNEVIHRTGDVIFGIAFGGGVLAVAWRLWSHVVIDPERDEVRLRNRLIPRTLPLSDFHTLVHTRCSNTRTIGSSPTAMAQMATTTVSVHELLLEGDERRVRLSRSKNAEASPEHCDPPALAKQLGLEFELRARDTPWWNVWRLLWG